LLPAASAAWVLVVLLVPLALLPLSLTLLLLWLACFVLSKSVCEPGLMLPVCCVLLEYKKVCGVAIEAATTTKKTMKQPAGQQGG
jgi:hypothetical protein